MSYDILFNRDDLAQLKSMRLDQSSVWLAQLVTQLPNFNKKNEFEVLARLTVLSENSLGDLELRVQIQLKACFLCSRCAESFVFSIEHSMDVIYKEALESQFSQKERVLSSEELDTYFYVKRPDTSLCLDLQELLNDALNLAVPETLNPDVDGVSAFHLCANADLKIADEKDVEDLTRNSPFAVLESLKIQ
ncbi:MAG: DUF177 domain-containing protein [Oligoflexales bacterium]|nr:DUF177 domain-containing protein [Oligoflexales bacterium]